MDHYFRTKALLFTKYAKTTSCGIYPASFSSAQQKYLQDYARCASLYTFGKDDTADIWADNFKETPYLSVDLHYTGKVLSIKSTLLGQFNADNMMIATVLCKHLGVQDDVIVSALNTFP